MPNHSPKNQVNYPRTLKRSATENGGTSASTVNFAAGTNNLDLRTFDDNAGGVALTVNVAGTATTDVLNVTAGNATAANGAVGGITWGAAAVTINGAETVNLSSIGAANTFGGAFNITDTAATQALVITGNQNAIFNGAVRADSINAGGMTGTAVLQLNAGTGATATAITGTANNDVLIGSTAGDIIAGGAGNDTISNQVAGDSRATAGDVLTGGAGQDTFSLFGSVASGAYTGLIASASQITDFTYSATAAATDILSLSDTLNNYAAFGTVITSITGDAAAAGATAVQTVAQNAAATGLVAGADLVKLTTGVATAGLTVQQIFDAAIGTASVTGLAAANTGAFVTAFDTTNNKVIVMLASTGADTTLATGDIVQLIGTIDMSAADYANFGANQLAIVA